MYFEVIGEICEIETIARGPSVRERTRLRKQFGGSRWRKLNNVVGLYLMLLLQKENPVVR